MSRVWFCDVVVWSVFPPFLFSFNSVSRKPARKKGRCIINLLMPLVLAPSYGYDVVFGVHCALFGSIDSGFLLSLLPLLSRSFSIGSCLWYDMYFHAS